MRFLKVVFLLIIFICLFQPPKTDAIIIPEGNKGFKVTPILNSYVAKPGDTLWKLAEERVDKTMIFPDASPSSYIAVINAIKNAEIIINNNK